ncbi:MAG: hypothetical protein WBW68_20900 [Terracidiphilus sp.]
MPRVPRLASVLLIAAAAVLALHAQQTSQKSAKVLPRPFALLVPYIATVAGKPFTAAYPIKVQRPLAAGGSETWQSTTLVARDLSGRTRHELHDYVPASFTKEPPVLSVILTDPVARLIHILNPAISMDDRQWFHVPKSSLLDGDGPAGENLGIRTIDGLETKGVRHAWTTHSRPSASGQPVRIVDETWYSKDMQLIVFEQQRDSAGGVLTIAMSRFDPSQPSASLFKVPWFYSLPTPPKPPTPTRPPMPGPGFPGWPSAPAGSSWVGPIQAPETSSDYPW